MIVIGLTGSIGMGKSEVAKIFLKRGIPVFDSDAEVHGLYDSQRGGDLLRPLVPAALRNNIVDRKLLSNIVLNDGDLLSKLEAIVHAEIALRRDSFVAQAKQAGHAIAVVDVPLLFEKAAAKFVDIAIVVSSPPELQHKRVLARPGMTKERMKVILDRQMSDSKKRKLADVIIENDGSLAELETKVLAALTAIESKYRK